ncbi:MAG TPA: hypothetical protein VMV77_02755 [Bacteroidales bacterium]|nr:hypothetical protein [Bacteroidales bacterium]
MKIFSLLLLILVFISSIIDGQDKKVYQDGYLVKIGDMAPDFTVREAGDESYILSDLKGKDSLTEKNLKR